VARNITRVMLPGAVLFTNNLKFAEALDLLMLFKGQTQADVEIELSNLEELPAADKVQRFRSDAKGIACMTWLPKGMNTLGALFERPNHGSLGKASRAVGADKFGLAATLIFVR